MPLSRPIGRLTRHASPMRGAGSTLLLRPWRTGRGRLALWGVAFAGAVFASLAVAAAPAAAQKTTTTAARSTPARDPQILCDTTPVKLVRRTPVKPRGVAAGHRRKVVHTTPVAKVAAKPKAAAVHKAAGRRRHVKPVAPRKPNCVKAAAAVVPTPEAKQALVAALPWTAPTEVAVPELSPFSLPGTIGGGSNAWALGLAGLSAFYFVGHDHSEAPVTIVTPPPTVTPEPATFALLGTGLAGLAAAAGLKRRRSGRNG